MTRSPEQESALRAVKIGAIVPEYRRDRAIRQGKVDEAYLQSSRKDTAEKAARRAIAMQSGCADDEVIRHELDGRKIGRSLRSKILVGKRIIRG